MKQNILYVHIYIQYIYMYSNKT